MNDLTKNEMNALLKILKNYTMKYNANNLSAELNITSMGTLKILKNLFSQHILKSETIGKANIFKINFANDYSRDYLRFLLKKESVDSVPRVKRWVTELKKLGPYVDIIILFGSVVRSDKYNDVDVILVFKESNIKQVNKSIDEINMLSSNKIHPVRQTIKDFNENLLKKSPALVDAVKNGIVVVGHDKYLEVMQNVSD